MSERRFNDLEQRDERVNMCASVAGFMSRSWVMADVKNFLQNYLARNEVARTIWNNKNLFSNLFPISRFESSRKPSDMEN